MYLIVCPIVVSILWFYWFIDSHWPSRPTTVSLGADFCRGTRELDNITSNGTSLFVGIMSKPDHFLQRKSLRDTWLTKASLNNYTQYTFLIGKHLCDIHTLDRNSEYSCERVKFSVSEDIFDNTILYANSKNLSLADRDLEPSVGFSFVVHHQIIVHSLGLNLDLPKVANCSHVKVVLSDMRRKIDIASVTFNTHSLSSNWNNKGYDFKRLENPVLLPKGFEGNVKVKMIKTRTTWGSCKHSSDWTHRSLIGVSRLLKFNGNGLFNAPSDYCALATFSFTIKDLETLRQHIEGEKNRTKRCLKDNWKILEDVGNEADLYGDILFLDMVDVYRLLPLKLKLFLKWVYENHNTTYVLKTDDDTLLDLPRISAEVSSLRSQRPWHWWSCMRSGWPVHRSGKAREDVFERDVYPMFPSGAGYVLAPQTVAWLNSRMDELSTAYQGEDTALGIWLEAMRPIPMTEARAECQWSCGEHYKMAAMPCNAMQLPIRKMYSLWGRYLLCAGRICDI